MNLGVVALRSVFPVRLLIVVFGVCPGLFRLVSFAFVLVILFFVLPMGVILSMRLGVDSGIL